MTLNYIISKRADARIRPEQFTSVLRVSVPAVLSSQMSIDDEKGTEELP